MASLAHSDDALRLRTDEWTCRNRKVEHLENGVPGEYELGGSAVVRTCALFVKNPLLEHTWQIADVYSSHCFVAAMLAKKYAVASVNYEKELESKSNTLEAAEARSWG